MPPVLDQIPGAPNPPRKLWSRAEDEGLSWSGDVDCPKLELVEGELIDKSRRKRP